jgi:hypothetical protein
MVMTRPIGFTKVDTNPATESQLREFKKSADANLGRFVAEVLELSYGSSPPGLHQTYPEGAAAPALELGRRYLAFAAEPSETGVTEFTA